MAITAGDVTRLDKMNRAAQRATLGTDFLAAQTAITALETNRVYYTSACVTQVQQSASAVVLYNVNATNGGFTYQVFRSSSPLTLVNGFKYARSGGSLTISPYASGSFTVGDLVEAVIW